MMAKMVQQQAKFKDTSMNVKADQASVQGPSHKHAMMRLVISRWFIVRFALSG